MELPPIKPIYGNRALACFIISLPLTTAILIVILAGPALILSTGFPLFILAIAVLIAGIVFGIRAHLRKEEKFRYQFALYFNVTMLFCLLMMLGMFIFVHIEGLG